MGAEDKKSPFSLRAALGAQWLPLTVLLLYLWAFGASKDEAIRALVLAGESFVSVLPILIAVMALTGLIQVRVDRGRVAKWLGPGSGAKALIFAALCGMLLIGPPYVIFPLLLSLRRQGARWAVVVTVLAAWAVKIQMLPLEVQYLGWPFAIGRSLITLAFAIPLGLLVEAVMEAGRPRG